jgi:hypothetical protein
MEPEEFLEERHKQLVELFPKCQVLLAVLGFYMYVEKKNMSVFTALQRLSRLDSRNPEL